MYRLFAAALAAGAGAAKQRLPNPAAARPVGAREHPHDRQELGGTDRGAPIGRTHRLLEAGALLERVAELFCRAPGDSHREGAEPACADAGAHERRHRADRLAERLTESALEGRVGRKGVLRRLAQLVPPIEDIDVARVRLRHDPRADDLALFGRRLLVPGQILVDEGEIREPDRRLGCARPARRDRAPVDRLEVAHQALVALRRGDAQALGRAGDRPRAAARDGGTHGAYLGEDAGVLRLCSRLSGKRGGGGRGRGRGDGRGDGARRRREGRRLYLGKIKGRAEGVGAFWRGVVREVALKIKGRAEGVVHRQPSVPQRVASCAVRAREAARP